MFMGRMRHGGQDTILLQGCARLKVLTTLRSEVTYFYKPIQLSNQRSKVACNFHSSCPAPVTSVTSSISMSALFNDLWRLRATSMRE